MKETSKRFLAYKKHHRGDRYFKQEQGQLRLDKVDIEHSEGVRYQSYVNVCTKKASTDLDSFQ